MRYINLRLLTYLLTYLLITASVSLPDLGLLLRPMFPYRNRASVSLQWRIFQKVNKKYTILLRQSFWILQLLSCLVRIDEHCHNPIL